MQNAGRPLILSFRALPSPWFTGRPNGTGTGTDNMGAVAPLGREQEALSEPEPEPDQQPHVADALDESVPVDAGANATAAQDML